MFMRDTSKQLAASERAHRDDKLGSANFFRQRDQLGLVKFFRAVRGEAPGWPSQFVDQHRNFSRVRAKVGVHMFDVLGPQPQDDKAGFEQINQVNGKWAVGPTTDLPDKIKGFDYAGGAGEQDPQEGNDERHRAAAQDIARARALQLIFFALQGIFPAPHRDSKNLLVLPFEG